MVNRLADELRLWFRLSPGFSCDLDRSFGKFTNLEHVLSSLQTASDRVRCHLDPYGRSRSRGCGPDDEASSEQGIPSGEPVFVKPADGAAACKVDPNRLVFKHAPKFQAEKFLSDPLLKSGFMNPKCFRSPKETWPRVKQARVMCSRERLLALFKKWDSVDSLYLLPATQSEQKYRCGLFTVYKNEEKDRQIF